MSVTSRNPLRFAGATVNSGFPNTGEVPWTRGGMATATVYSGGLLAPGSGFLPAGAVKTADQILLVSGPGRLNTIVPLNSVFALSGVPNIFYDSTVVARSGGPVSESGYRTLALLNAPNGQSGLLTFTAPIPVDMPFTSGLSVSCVSGTTGFTVSFTPETNPTNPNNF